MRGLSKLLSVPYFAQPTGNSCQSTVLKMFATYLEQTVVQQSTGAGDRDILDIRKDINHGASRPDKKYTNSHANMKWWLQEHFPSLTFHYLNLKSPDQAIEKLVYFIDRGFPVLVSVSHAKVDGHIILVVGYEGYQPNASAPDFRLVVHDPYGAFDPSLLSSTYGKKRWDRGMSLQSGGEIGPGTAVRLELEGASRHKKTDKARGTFILLSATR